MMPFRLLVRDTMKIDPPFRDRLAAAGLDTLPAVLQTRGDRLAAWSRTTDAIRSDLPDGAIYIKRYHNPQLGKMLKGFFRGSFFGTSRARAEYLTLTRMRKLGIHAVRPVAWGERRIAGLVRSSFLISEAVPDAMSLATFVLTFSGRTQSHSRMRQRHEILRSLAQEIRRMHEAGFVHQDLFWRNVLIRPLGQDRFEFYFLDASLGRRIRGRRRRRDRIVHDLAALSVLAPDFLSRADQVRFIKQYLGQKRLSPADRQWLLDVQKHWQLYRETERDRLERIKFFERPLMFPRAVAGVH